MNRLFFNIFLKFLNFLSESDKRRHQFRITYGIITSNSGYGEHKIIGGDVYEKIRFS